MGVTCELGTAYRFRYKQAPSSPSSWISAPPSSIERTETHSLQIRRKTFSVKAAATEDTQNMCRAKQQQLGVPSGLIWGSNFSDVTSLRSSGLRLHTLTPSAAPAAIAAPRAVVSGMDGFTGSNNTVNISHIAILYNKTVCVCPASWHMINEFYTRLVDSQLSDLVSCIFTFQGFCGFFCLIVDKRK